MGGGGGGRGRKEGRRGEVGGRYGKRRVGVIWGEKGVGEYGEGGEGDGESVG